MKKRKNMTENEKIDKFVSEYSPEELVGLLALVMFRAYSNRADLEKMAKAFELEEILVSRDDVRLAEWLEKVGQFLKENKELIRELSYGRGYD